MTDQDDDVFVIEDEAGEIVHWCEAPPRRLSAGQAAGATLTAFALGALGAVAVLALLGRIRD